MSGEQPIPFSAERFLFGLEGVLLGSQRRVLGGMALGRFPIRLGQCLLNGVCTFWTCNPIDKLFQWCNLVKVKVDQVGTMGVPSVDQLVASSFGVQVGHGPSLSRFFQLCLAITLRGLQIDQSLLLDIHRRMSRLQVTNVLPAFAGGIAQQSGRLLDFCRSQLGQIFRHEGDQQVVRER